MGVLSDIAGSGGIGKMLGGMRKKKRPGGGSVTSGGAAGGDDAGPMDSYHRGGKVRKTGVARLKKGETVMTKGQMKRMKMRGKKR